jgi:cytochrome c peroxidase
MHSSYKQVETISEYYFPAVSSYKMVQPCQNLKKMMERLWLPGFQVIEEFIFGI